MNYQVFHALCAPFMDVPHETFIKLERYVELVLNEQQNQNLIGPATVEIIWYRHIFDSLQLVRLLQDNGPILDLGSGAGFPGLIFNIVTSRAVTLVESEGRKARFLQSVVDALWLTATIECKRIESLSRELKPAYVTARALAPLPKLLGLALPWLGHGTTGIFPKGQSWQDEVTAARTKWNFRLQSYPSLSHDQAQILVVRDLAPR